MTWMDNSDGCLKMSGERAGDYDHTYAVVDKKKRSRDTQKNTIAGRSVDVDQYVENIFPSTEMSVIVKDSAVHDDISAPTYSILDRSTARVETPERKPPKKQLGLSIDEKAQTIDNPKMKNCGVKLICPVALLVGVTFLTAASIVLIVAFVQISKLSAEVALLQSTSPSKNTIMANSIHISELAESVQVLKSSMDTRFEIELEALRETLDANITWLALNLQNTTAVNLSVHVYEINNCLESIINSTAIQRIDKATGNNSITQLCLLVDVLNDTGYAFPSCAAIGQLCPSSPSGMYHVRSTNGYCINNVYCDMTRSCGNMTGGWMRVAELDMTDVNTTCLSSLRLNKIPRRTCRTMYSHSAICSSDTFTVGGVGYSKVCGRIRAYQVGTTGAFVIRNNDIDTNYVDGVSLTHGRSPRQHIWSFAAAINEYSIYPNRQCPCIGTSTSNTDARIPLFVGDDYFCDTAALHDYPGMLFNARDPLWDGAGCGHNSTCCSFNSPPWFYKKLPQVTTDDIEMRVCRDQKTANEDIAIEVVEIYVQ